MKRVVAYAAWAKKALVATAGVAAQGLALGIFHGQALVAAQLVVAVATAVGVAGVRNGPKPGGEAK